MARNKAVPAVYVVFEKDGKILIARRCNTGYQDGRYHLPSGHIEESELPTKAAAREAKEEVGVDIDPADLEMMLASYRPKHDETGDRVDYFFRTRKWTGELHIAEPDKCDDLQWVAWNNLPENMTPNVRASLQAIAKGIRYQELDIDFLKRHGQYNL